MCEVIDLRTLGLRDVYLSINSKHLRMRLGFIISTWNFKQEFIMLGILLETLFCSWHFKKNSIYVCVMWFEKSFFYFIIWEKSAKVWDFDTDTKITTKFEFLSPNLFKIVYTKIDNCLSIVFFTYLSNLSYPFLRNIELELRAPSFLKLTMKQVGPQCSKNGKNCNNKCLYDLVWKTQSPDFDL